MKWHRDTLNNTKENRNICSWKAVFQNHTIPTYVPSDEQTPIKCRLQNSGSNLNKTRKKWS